MGQLMILLCGHKTRAEASKTNRLLRHGLWPGMFVTPMCIGLDENCRVQHILFRRTKVFMVETQTATTSIPEPVGRQIPPALRSVQGAVRRHHLLLLLGSHVAVDRRLAAILTRLRSKFVQVEANVK